MTTYLQHPARLGTAAAAAPCAGALTFAMPCGRLPSTVGTGQNMAKPAMVSP